MRILERRPGMQATTYAEAQALVDDGLDVGLVLELFAADAAWLAPLLSASNSIFLAAETSQPSYFFDASLKRKFIGAGIRQARQGRGTPVLEVATSRGRMRTAMASTALVGAAAAIGVAAFTVIRTENTGPTTPDRGTLSVSKLDTHLLQSQAHVSQILEKAATTGQVSEVDLAVIDADTKVLTAYAQEAPLDAAQKDSAKAYVEKAVKVIADAQARPELDAKAKSTFDTVATAAQAAGLEGVKGIATPAPTATPEATATGTSTPASSATPSASPKGETSPAPTAPASPTPSATASASPTATSTAENGR